ncbi:MAG: hypothetical protein HW410_1518 [Nitrosarchaeum sp.]|nr:hypothetical protein [Nitrosarchaeum sp.]
MKRVVSVSKTYIHRGKRRHRSNTKKHWFIYYYDEDDKFKSEQVSWIEAQYYKMIKLRRLKQFCSQCGNTFLTLVLTEKQKIQCPHCTD